MERHEYVEEFETDVESCVSGGRRGLRGGLRCIIRRRAMDDLRNDGVELDLRKIG